MKTIFLFGISTAVVLGILCSGDIAGQVFTQQSGVTLSYLADDASFGGSQMRKTDEEKTNNTSDDLAAAEDVSNGSVAKKHTYLIEKFKMSWPIWRWREYGFFTDDYLDVINEHWLQFPPPGETWQRALASLYVLICAVGGWGNIVVLLMYFK